ncbi:hypothetical protein, partial [Staphylococcus aureus]|uniref:hypothetical protein n=1 Tax=Staphylococcus aureus TaxID=1280 RepID=UPI0038B34994
FRTGTGRAAAKQKATEKKCWHSRRTHENPYAKQIGGALAPPGDLEIQMLTEDYHKRLNLIFTPTPTNAPFISGR